MLCKKKERLVFIRNNNENGGVDKYLDQIAVLRLTEDMCVCDMYFI